MKITQTKIPDVVVVQPKVFYDDRGYFFESFSELSFNCLVTDEFRFVQDNQSFSKEGTVRGLHFQLPPKSQGKLVRVIDGSIFDVAVDLRLKSKTFGEWVSVNLNSEKQNQLWIPPGFAHGFQTISEYAIVSYKTTDFYSPENERCVAWDDHDLAISWPIVDKPAISAKDKKGLPFKQCNTF